MMRKLAQLKRPHEESGFTLVEVVVAMVLIGILAVAAYPIMFNSLKALSLNNLTTSATVKVQDVIEDIRQTPTCENLNNLASTEHKFRDARNIGYEVRVILPDGCIDAEAVEVRFTATRSSDNKVLLNQLTQIFVPPISGEFDLD